MDPVERALSTLVHASRVSPILREAVATVEDEIRRLRDGVLISEDLAHRLMSTEGVRGTVWDELDRACRCERD